MSKVTSKLQVTLPKAIATRYGVAPGSDLVFEPAGESIRVLVAREAGLAHASLSIKDKEALFAAATARQAVRNRRNRAAVSAAKRKKPGPAAGRGWSREDPYRA